MAIAGPNSSALYLRYVGALFFGGDVLEANAALWIPAIGGDGSSVEIDTNIVDDAEASVSKQPRQEQPGLHLRNWLSDRRSVSRASILPDNRVCGRWRLIAGSSIGATTRTCCDSDQESNEAHASAYPVLGTGANAAVSPIRYTAAG